MLKKTKEDEAELKWRLYPVGVQTAETAASWITGMPLPELLECNGSLPASSSIDDDDEGQAEAVAPESPPLLLPARVSCPKQSPNLFFY